MVANPIVIISATVLPFGILSTVVFDVCQNATNEAHSFRVIGSYYENHPGVCTCSIWTFFPGPVPNIQEIHTRLSVNGDKCGYFVGTHKNDSKNCTACLDYSEMIFRKSENFTVYFERPSDYQQNIFWFDVSVPTIDHYVWLKIKCWLDEGRIKTTTCHPTVDSSPSVDGNETTTRDLNVSISSECKEVDSKDKLEIVCIFGWLIASVCLVFSFGLIVYTKIKSHKENKQKMASYASSDPLVDTSVPTLPEETEYVSAEYLDLNDIPQEGYQHLQFQGTCIDNTYEQLKEPSNIVIGPSCE